MKGGDASAYATHAPNDVDSVAFCGINGVNGVRLLEPGETCWRVARAHRVTYIVDTAAYFAAAKAAMRRAQRSIVILGWDFDPRLRFEPHKESDGTDELGRLLESLLDEKPELEVHILIWAMALPVAVQRLMIPYRAQWWLSHERLHYHLDHRHPPGACHHQKVLVVDDAVAFCGGTDFAGNRWDTSRHDGADPRRRTPDGQAYEPRHDVVMAVDGPAAAALGDLARARWRRATGEVLRAPDVANDPWPPWLAADLREVEVGIARTEPAWREQAEVREVEALHVRAIAAARRWIYVEYQYVASPLIGAALRARLREPDGPEIVIVCPEHSPSYFDRLAMDPVRDLLIDRLRKSDHHDRFRVFVPVAMDGTPIIVHAKVMIVDDRLVRIGSGNLNNRSFGFDTECDLAVDARHAARPADAVDVNRRFLVRLLAEHMAALPDRTARFLQETGSIIATIRALNRDTGRRLAAVRTEPPVGIGAVIGSHHLLDPRSTADNFRPWKRRISARARRRRSRDGPVQPAG